MIVNHDYLCECGHTWEHMYRSARDIRQALPCPECGQEAGIFYGSWRSMSVWNFSGDQKGREGCPGLRYGVVDPQTGVAYENWSHKKRVLKEMGLEETGDPVGGTRTDYDNFFSGATQGRPAGVLAADSVEEITQQIDQDRIDRAATGNPNRPIQDSWVSFDPDE